MICHFEFESCLDVYNFGLRRNGVYKIKENDQKVEKQCKLEFESCLDVYNLGLRTDGLKYMIKENGSRLKEKTCYFNIKDCTEWKELGYNEDGIYLIALPASGVKLVKCVMSIQKGGWIVIQQRFDGSVNFSRNWDDYREGFGTLNGEFWLGNKYLYELTANESHKWFFIATTFDGSNGTSCYEDFKVKSETQDFEMTASFKNGNNSLQDSIFSTFDRQNLKNSNVCTNKHDGGGFWHNSCGNFHPNGEYKKQATVPSKTGIYWHKFKGDSISMKKTLMLIKRH